MAFLAKSVIASWVIALGNAQTNSTTSTTSSWMGEGMSFNVDQDCNGLNVMGLYTWPADICLNSMESGFQTSHMIACNSDGNGELQMWFDADCQGSPLMAMSVDTMFDVSSMPGGIEMICGQTDCDYALVRSYDINGTDIEDIEMIEGFVATNSTGASTTQSGSSSGSGSGSSSEDWEDYIDCAENTFENWEESAIVLFTCFEYMFVEEMTMTMYIDYACSDGEFNMEFHMTDTCSGSPMMTEAHFAHEDSICPLVTCELGRDGSSTISSVVAMALAAIVLISSS